MKCSLPLYGVGPHPPPKGMIYHDLLSSEVRRRPLLGNGVNTLMGRHLVFLPENVVTLADCG
jgi:hypothetical protein